MTWPASIVPTTALDADTDSLVAARLELKAAVDALNEIITHLSGQTIWTSSTDGPTSGMAAQTAATATKHGVLNVKVIDIGDWNMDTSSGKGVLHGLDFTKIRGVSVLVRNDANSEVSPLDIFSGEIVGYWECLATSISLYRVPFGFYDQPSYDSTSYNRGYITIWYID